MSSALGLVQSLAWGSSLYLLGMLADPIIADTGWSRTVVTGGASVALVASGAVPLAVGRLIQAHGGRLVLAAGMGVFAAGLAAMAAAGSEAAYLTAWAVVGVGMGAGLYDAAFSTLGRIFGARARRAVTALTLWGGFASTVCWPLTALAVEAVGWRDACLLYVALHVAVTIPLCLAVLPREARWVAPASGHARGSVPVSDPRFWLVAVSAATLAGIATLWSVHLIAVLRTLGSAWRRRWCRWPARWR